MIVMDYQLTEEERRNFQDLLINARKTKINPKTKRPYTQAEVAEEIGLSQSLISDYERGPYPRMTFLDLFRIGQYYKIEPNQFARLLGLMPADPELEESKVDPDDVQQARILRSRIFKLPKRDRQIIYGTLKSILDTMEAENPHP